MSERVDSYWHISTIRLYNVIQVVACWKYRTEDKLKVQTIQKLNITNKKKTMQKTAKQNYPGLVASYETQPGKKPRNIKKKLEHKNQ